MANHRRNEIQIAVAVLSAIEEESRVRQGEARKTRLQASAYLNWRTLNCWLQRLQELDLIAPGGLRITDRGVRFLQAYRQQLQPILEGFGF